MSENSIRRVLGPLGQEGVVGRRGRLVHQHLKVRNIEARSLGDMAM